MNAPYPLPANRERAIMRRRMAAGIAIKAGRTTQFYDRRRDEMTLDEGEKIGL